VHEILNAMLQMPQGIGHDRRFTSRNHYLKVQAGAASGEATHRTTNHQIVRLLTSNWRPRSICLVAMIAGSAR
jgi:hypothetical protein